MTSKSRILLVERNVQEVISPSELGAKMAQEATWLTLIPPHLAFGIIVSFCIIILDFLSDIVIENPSNQMEPLHLYCSILLSLVTIIVKLFIMACWCF